jgi:hypothetical protein
MEAWSEALKNEPKVHGFCATLRSNWDAAAAFEQLGAPEFLLVNAVLKEPPSIFREIVQEKQIAVAKVNGAFAAWAFSLDLRTFEGVDYRACAFLLKTGGDHDGPPVSCFHSSHSRITVTKIEPRAFAPPSQHMAERSHTRFIRYAVLGLSFLSFTRMRHNDNHE